MSSPNAPSIRPPAVAGRFYPAQADQCRAQARSFLAASVAAEVAGGRWLGGVVPHAGWVCSGAVAGQTVSVLAAQGAVDVVVVFGAIHTPIATAVAALDRHSVWRLPGADAGISTELTAALVEDAGAFVVDERFHAREHAVEVNVPLIQLAWPGAALLPIEIPTIDTAAEIGRRTARRLAAKHVKAVYLASSDFTHYGPDYRFTPAGVGPAALEWAKDNDRRLLDLVVGLKTEQVVGQVRSRHNACGGGAIAAMLAACQEQGATRAKLLRHTTSFETLADIAPQPPTNSVGYAAVVVG